MKTAIVPGSFDPVSRGHIDLIERAAKIFDKVYAACLLNENKTYLFSDKQREKMLEAAVSHLDNVEVESFSGWMYEYVKLKKADAIVKGVRNKEDLAYEKEHADFNKAHSGIDTLLIISDERYADVSSTEIRRRLKNGEELSRFVCKEVEKLIYEYLGGDNNE